MFWKEWRRKNTSLRVTPRAQVFLLSCLFSLAIIQLGAAADRVKELQEHFDREKNSTGKIKAFEKLGEAQFAAATRAGQVNDFATVAFTFEKYRDNARAAFDLLNQQQPDADHHPDGYRHLELQVRRGTREVEETIIIVPDEVRPPLRIVRQDLINLDDALIAKLFPRRTKDPGKNPLLPETKP